MSINLTLFSRNKPQYSTPHDFRMQVRQGNWTGQTSGLCPGYTQTNLVVIPKEDAFDFLLFATRNPKPCPILEVLEPGQTEPFSLAPKADIRTDIPKYRVYQKGSLIDEPNNIHKYWDDQLVSFLIGCSFTFETALIQNDILVKHITLNQNVPMFITNIACKKAGRFQGPMVVSMRPINEKKLVRAVQVSSRFPSVHGAPVHIGNPEVVGINDLSRPDFGDPITVDNGEIPVFWACGVTPQAIAQTAKPELMITHSPGHMFVTDLNDQALSVFYNYNVEPLKRFCLPFQPLSPYLL